ncbi:MAG: tetratricopeptide repeat protein 38 family protein [Rhizobiales bacterium PAR1]|nr:MAG: tetratricopeptide repeat protein 38 family protein [Rhizobiales bacterium PAR1]
MVEAFLAHGKETPDFLQRFITEEPANPRGPAIRALMLTLLARRELLRPAQEAAAAALALLARQNACRGERAFVEAASAASHGAWWAALDQLEIAITENPADTLAAKLSHNLRFMLGDKAGMLCSIERVLKNLPARHQHRGFLLGCHAFALEENGDYARAERVGQNAVALESRDAWGLHAVSHVHEMTGRVEDGIRWIEGSEAAFRHCNNFGGHLFWHLALFKLEKGAVGEVLALYDGHIRRDETDDFRDIANGASLLMRLELHGHDVGARWEELADKAEARIADRSLIFADLHYMLALIGGGRREAAGQLARSIAEVPASVSAQNLIAQRAGRGTAKGLLAFADGDMGRAVDCLAGSRRMRGGVGGSDAQRDVFEMVMIEAGLQAGEDRLVRSILSERLAARGGHNRFAETRLARLGRSISSARGALSLKAALAFAVPAH